MGQERFGRYRLESLIGAGGMGEVYRAVDTDKDRTVALKRLSPHLAADRDFTARFERESRLASRLREPHIIPIHDFGAIDGRLFIDMRLVEGADLAVLIARHGGLPASRTVGIVAQIADALDAAHADGLVHRDVKPSNVLLAGADRGERHDFCYLVDFGVARTDTGAGSTALTETGATVGTLAYVAPERFRNAPYGHRVDVYALACILHEALTGARPYEGDSLALMYAHLNAPPPRPSRWLGVPPGMDAVIARGMAKNPEERYASAGELAVAARAALAGQAMPPPVPPAPVTAVSTPGDPLVPRPVLLAPPTATPAPAARRPPSRRKLLGLGVALVAVLGLVAAGIVVLVRTQATPAPPAPTTVVASIPVSDNPWGIAISPDGRRVYTTHLWEAGTVSMIDTGTNVTTTTVPAGTAPVGIAVSPDGTHLYVADSGNLDGDSKNTPTGLDPLRDTVTVIDAVANSRTVSLPAGDNPFDVVVSPDGARIYVSNNNSASVTVFDTATNTATATIPVGQAPNDLAIAPDGKHVYVTNYRDNTISVVDTAQNAAVATIPVGTGPESVVVTPDGQRVYVTDFTANAVSVIDTTRNVVVATIPVGTAPRGVGVTPDGSRIYVANQNSNSVSVIDTSDNTVAATVGLTGAPGNLVVSPDGARVYVTQPPSNTVAVLGQAPR